MPEVRMGVLQGRLREVMKRSGLYAMRDDRLRKISPTTSRTEAAHIVETMEDRGTWPEGWDAVLYVPGQTTVVYIDGWDQLL